MLKEAFKALPADEQAYFQPTIDAMASEAKRLGLGADGKYALAWIKLGGQHTMPRPMTVYL